MAHILIIDDEATIRFLFRTQLELADHKTLAHKVSGRLTKPFDMQALITMVNSLVSLPIDLPSSEPI